MTKRLGVCLTILCLMGSGCEASSMKFSTPVHTPRQLIHVALATTPEEQALGLGERDSLAPDQGMVFVFAEPGPYSFWMKGMRFSIDLVWIHQKKVVGVSANVPAPQSSTEPPVIVSPPEPIDRVLELPAGRAEAYGIRSGVVLSDLP